jgi:hypothetical protein
VEGPRFKSLRENSPDECHSPLRQRIGFLILRAFREGWDGQKLRGSASGEEQWNPTLRKEREGWGTRSFVAGQEIRFFYGPPRSPRTLKPMWLLQ